MQLFLFPFQASGVMCLHNLLLLMTLRADAFPAPSSQQGFASNIFGFVATRAWDLPRPGQPHVFTAEDFNASSVVIQLRSGLNSTESDAGISGVCFNEKDARALYPAHIGHIGNAFPLQMQQVYQHA